MTKKQAVDYLSEIAKTQNLVGALAQDALDNDEWKWNRVNENCYTINGSKVGC